MASPCLCKPPTASEPASRVKPVLKQTFGRASREVAREALPRAVPNGALLHVSRPGARQVKTPTATSGFFYTEYKLFGSVRAIQVVVVEHLLCSFMGG